MHVSAAGLNDKEPNLSQSSQALCSETPLTARVNDALARSENLLKTLYEDHPNWVSAWADLHARVIAAKETRPIALKLRDEALSGTVPSALRPGRPAYCTYIDRFGGNIAGAVTHLDYLKSLNVGIVHPLPLLKPREGDSDGGFAVADYRDVDPRLGSLDDLSKFAEAVHDRDMALIIDMVCNHTAREHRWAQAMLAGDPYFADFYHVIQTSAEFESWEAHLQDVFPETAPGNFTFIPEAKGWVWTTFYPFQWDLNYANPRVFVEMLDCLLFLANIGVDGFRLDSTPFLWKQPGTACRNRPETHLIIQAMRILINAVAPQTILLAEAIESQEAVLPFFGVPEAPECDLAYNNSVMTALWGAIADQSTDLLAQTLNAAATKPDHGQWLNYVRCHDDIIWLALSDLASHDRLKGWSDFFAGKDSSFAKGMTFQAPPGFPASGCGMAASLCGGHNDPMMPQRLLLMYGVTYAQEGIPLLYMGDEIALENDYGFLDDPDRRDEIRWLHRPSMDWQKAEKRHDVQSTEAIIFKGLSEYARILNGLAFDVGQVVKPSSDPAILILRRPLVTGETFVCTANFSDKPRPVSITGRILTGQAHVPETNQIAPYGLIWTLEPATISPAP
ncbi:MAG: alpha-amylase family glycosyl hydrolase [Asticcacaulis sp.]